MFPTEPPTNFEQFDLLFKLLFRKEDCQNIIMDLTSLVLDRLRKSEAETGKRYQDLTSFIAFSAMIIPIIVKADDNYGINPPKEDYSNN